MASSSFSTISSSSSSSSSASSLPSKSARPRTIPRRGQIRQAIFSSILAAIRSYLQAKSPKKNGNGANSEDGASSQTRTSNFKLDVDGGLSADEAAGFGLSVRSSPMSMSSSSVTPTSPYKPLPRPRSFYGGMHGRAG